MSSIVLELQQELLLKDCDIIQVLRKAHVIAVKLGLKEFDHWIQNELNGYDRKSDSLPDYRKMRGELKAKNPYRGWIPAVTLDSKQYNELSTAPMYESLSALIDISKKATDDQILFCYSPEFSQKFCKNSNSPIYMEIAIFISTFRITEAIELVKNRLLEWTLELEGKGILGEGMTFNETEKAAASTVKQQVNYYGTVVNGDIKSSQIVSGNNNSSTFNISELKKDIEEIRESLDKEILSPDEKEAAIEILEDISTKIDQNKKATVVKSALMGLKELLISAGGEMTATLIMAKMQGLL